MKNDCNNHGHCISNETCLCDNSYSGDTCDQCIQNRFAYPSCVECPSCVRGRALCNSSLVMCDCINNTRIYGDLCQYCRTGYYGPNCDTIPVVFEMTPRSGLELDDGNMVTFFGDNFQNVSSFCLLNDRNQTISLLARVVDSQNLICSFPIHPAEIVGVRLIQENKTVLSQNNLNYEYLPSCPSSGCTHGSCVMGTCYCSYPYFGTNCSSYPVPPLLASLPHLNALEGSSLNQSLLEYLIAGDSPIEWFLSGNIPNGLSINSISGQLFWSSTAASVSNYSIRVGVQQLSTGAIYQQILSISVPPTYNVTVRFQRSQEIITELALLQIIGEVSNLTSQQRVTRRANVWIRVGVVLRYLPIVIIKAGTNVFTTTYSPLSYEYGTVFVGAEHPAILSTTQSQDFVTLFGLNVQRIVATTLKIQSGDNHNNTFYGVALLTNPSNLSIYNLSTLLDSPKSAVSFFEISLSNCSLTVIPPFASCSLDLSVKFKTTGAGNLIFSFVNGVIRPASLSLPIVVTADRADFEVFPSFTELILPRNSQQTKVIFVRNTGSFRLGPLSVQLPYQTYVFTSTPEISNIQQSANVSITLVIQVPDSAPLITVRLRGVILDKTYFVSQAFDLSFTIVGRDDVLFPVNFLCKDEFSYFGANSVNLANVTITIINTVLHKENIILQSNQSGQASVSLAAGTYEVRAQAVKHASFSKIMTIDRATVSVDDIVIFLQRIFVSYSFSVTPVSVEQTYTITIDAQFTTYVPAPVLVVSPTAFDLDELEENEDINQIDITFTNYGLIRLQDLQLSLPTTHSFLKFKIRQEQIGDLEANSSIIVAIAVNHTSVSRSKRATYIDMAANYSASYICDGLRKIIGLLPVFTRKVIIVEPGPPTEIPPVSIVQVYFKRINLL